ncbi:hypothetical protein [Bordetella avium]|nr:hypothetical protein [Bordetella avium]
MSKINVLRLLHLSDTNPVVAERLRPFEGCSVMAVLDTLAGLSSEFGLPFTSDEARAVLTSHEGLPRYLAGGYNDGLGLTRSAFLSQAPPGLPSTHPRRPTVRARPQSERGSA